MNCLIVAEDALERFEEGPCLSEEREEPLEGAAKLNMPKMKLQIYYNLMNNKRQCQVVSHTASLLRGGQLCEWVNDLCNSLFCLAKEKFPYHTAMNRSKH